MTLIMRIALLSDLEEFGVDCVESGLLTETVPEPQTPTGNQHGNRSILKQKKCGMSMSMMFHRH